MKILKFKIYVSKPYWVNTSKSSSKSIADYTYQVYFLGVLLHSIVMRGMDYDTIKTMFPNIEPIKTIITE